MRKNTKRPPPPRRRPVKTVSQPQPQLSEERRPNRGLRAADVCARYNICRVTLWRWVKSGKYPAPKLVGTILVWDEAEDQAWWASRPKPDYAPEVA